MYLTKGINEKITTDLDFSKFVLKSMNRFNEKDWGDLCKEDKALNNYELEHQEGKIVARYNHINGVDDIYIMATYYNGQVKVEIMFCSEY